MSEQRAELLKFGQEWNEIAAAHNLPRIDLIIARSARERQALDTMSWLREHYNSDYVEYLAKIRASPYLLGKVKEFRATFDWIIAPRNRHKIWENNYADREQNNGNGFAGGSFAYHQRR
jgi:hypothetical protein